MSSVRIAIFTDLMFFSASIYWTWSSSLKPGRTTQLYSQVRREGMVIKTSLASNYSQFYTAAVEPIKILHGVSCNDNPGLITPSLSSDLVANDFRNDFYFTTICEQAAVCTWKQSTCIRQVYNMSNGTERSRSDLFLRALHGAFRGWKPALKKEEMIWRESAFK